MELPGLEGAGRRRYYYDVLNCGELLPLSLLLLLLLLVFLLLLVLYFVGIVIIRSIISCPAAPPGVAYQSGGE